MRCRRGAVVLLLCIPPLAAAGCWDFRDVEERSLVLMLGIDQGRQEAYRVSVQIPIPRGGAPEAVLASDFRTFTEEGPSVDAAIERIRASMYRYLELGQVKVVVVGDSLARQGPQNLDWLWRTRRVPLVAFVAATREPVEEVLRARTPPVAVPALFLYHAFRPTHAIDDEVLPVERWELFRDVRQPLQDAVLPGVTAQRYGLNVSGVAVFREGRLVGWLSPEEAAVINRLRRTRFYGSLTIPGKPGRPPAALLLTGGSARYGAYAGADGRPVLWVQIDAQAEMREGGQRSLDELEIDAGRELEAATRQVLARLQGLGSDPLGFGERLRRWEAGHPAVAGPETWRRAYALARVEVQAQVHIRTVGYER